MRFVNCLKKPCGRVEKQGSQQHEIEMVIPSKNIAERLAGYGLPGVCMHFKQRYFVDPETKIASWRESKSTDTYVIEDASLLGDYLSLHERNLSKKLMLYKASKLAPITKTSGYNACTVQITFLSPCTLEVRRRRANKWVVKAEINSQVVNDLMGHMLPPHYEYSPDMHPKFWQLSLDHLAGMRALGFPLSTKFLALIEGVPNPVIVSATSRRGKRRPRSVRLSPPPPPTFSRLLYVLVGPTCCTTSV